VLSAAEPRATRPRTPAANQVQVYTARKRGAAASGNRDGLGQSDQGALDEGRFRSALTSDRRAFFTEAWASIFEMLVSMIDEKDSAWPPDEFSPSAETLQT